MNKNRLFPGDVRVGWFLHEKSKESEQPSAAVLRNENGKITLTVPISFTEEGEILRRWFTGQSVSYSDDPDFVEFDYEPPRALIFVDSQGKIGLFNCRNVGYKSILGSAGEGYLRVGFAVFGAGTLDYAAPTHLRTYIPGMGAWTGLSSLSIESRPNSRGLGEQVTVFAEKPKSIELAPGVTLCTSWSFTHRQSDNWIQIQDPPFLETCISEGAEFSRHLVEHQAFLELVDIAYWQTTGYNRMQCYLEGDDELEIAKRWHDVDTTYVRHQSEPHKDNLNPLFFFGEIGPTGYQKWLEIRKRMSRAIAPIMGLLDLRESTIQTQFVQSCMGLEGIGVQLMRDAGLAEAEGKFLQRRLEQIIKSNGFSFSNDWPKRTAKLYNDIKHYDRDAVLDPLDIHNNLLENQLVFRAWVMLQVGISKENIEDRIQFTPAAQQLIGQKAIYFKNYPNLSTADR